VGYKNKSTAIITVVIECETWNESNNSFENNLCFSSLHPVLLLSYLIFFLPPMSIYPSPPPPPSSPYFPFLPLSNSSSLPRSFFLLPPFPHQHNSYKYLRTRREEEYRTSKLHTWETRTVNSEVMVIPPENTISMFHLGLLFHKFTIHASSVNTSTSET